MQSVENLGMRDMRVGDRKEELVARVFAASENNVQPDISHVQNICPMLKI